MHGRGLVIFAGCMIVLAVAALLASSVLDSAGIRADWTATWTMAIGGLVSGSRAWTGPICEAEVAFSCARTLTGSGSSGRA